MHKAVSMKPAAILSLLAMAASFGAAGCGQTATSLDAAPTAGAADAARARTLAFVLAGGRLQTHEVDPASGRFRPLASAAADGCAGLGVDPDGRFVFCSVHPSGRFAYAAWHTASVAAFAVEGGGALRRLAALPPPARAVAHDAVVDPSGGWLLTLGGRAMEIVSSRLGGAAGGPSARSAPRAGELRRIEMDPSGRFLWGIDPEADAPTVWAASFDAASGAVRVIEREPAGWRPTDLQLAGRFLYVANRGSGDVWGYALDRESGALRAIGRVAQVPSAGVLAADPEGRFLYVAGRSVFAFRREEDGRLSPLGRVAEGRAVAVARWPGSRR
jgi:DNA-binding beta-propeller fold protein YncE